jgi:hypothetical protein
VVGDAPRKAAAFGKRGRDARHVDQIAGSIESGQVVAGRPLGPDPVSLRPAGRAPSVEFELLLHGHEFERVELRAELARCLRVLDLEDRLAGLDERFEQVALDVLDAFLVDLEVEVRLEFGDLVGVATANCQSQVAF